jgi:hypothetical protein
MKICIFCIVYSWLEGRWDRQWSIYTFRCESADSGRDPIPSKNPRRKITPMQVYSSTSASKYLRCQYILVGPMMRIVRRRRIHKEGRRKYFGRHGKRELNIIRDWFIGTP